MSRIRPARFVHVVYRTRRFEQMIEWYRAVFDCRVQYQNPVLAFLTYDDEHHRVALINLSAVKPEASGRAAGHHRRRPCGLHLRLRRGSVGELRPAQGKGHRALLVRHHGVTMSMYYADPDGNQMELQVDAFASGDEANRYMLGPHFEANPIGVEYDPDEVAGEAALGHARLCLPTAPERPAGVADPRRTRSLASNTTRRAGLPTGGLPAAALRATCPAWGCRRSAEPLRLPLPSGNPPCWDTSSD